MICWSTLDEVDLAAYDALVIPGGDSPSNLKELPRAIEIVKAFGGSGRTMTGAHKIRREMGRAGAKFLDEPLWVAGNLITAKGYTEISRFVMAIEAAPD